MEGTKTLDVKTTKRCEMIDITTLVRAAIRASGNESGLACVFCSHTTAGITVQENSDPRVKSDLVRTIGAVVPQGGLPDAPFEHSQDNSDAHIKGSLIGASITLIVDGGRPILGPWQALYFCEFDGPRNRRVMVKVIAG